MSCKRVVSILSLMFLLWPVSVVNSSPKLPVSPNASEFFYSVSGTNEKIWIAPPTWKVMRDTEIPGNSASIVKLYAAANEYEPVQIIGRPGSNGNMSVSLEINWSGSSNSIKAELHEVRYVSITKIGSTTHDQHGEPGQWPDPLYPISFGENISVSAGENQPMWLTVYVPPGTSAGIYSNTLTVQVDESGYNIPIEIEVFNFEIPKEINFDSYANFTFNNLGESDIKRVDEIKMWFYKHRMVPLGVTWPSGFKWGIVWESSKKDPQYAPPVDEFDIESNANYRVRELADKYIMVNGFNDGIGFPSFEALRFVDNPIPRPDTFAGISRGDTHFGNAAYNEAWGKYLKALQNYFDPSVPYNPPESYGNPYGHDYLSKARYYVMNEPQNKTPDRDDYKLAAFLSKLAKQYAPKLKIMISEEAKPEIYNQADYPGNGYDIWLPNIPHYDSAVTDSWNRLKDHDEITWWYSLGHDSVPFINPILINHPGLEPRLLTWLAWKYRVEGYAYYSWKNWDSNMWDNPDFVREGANGEGFLFYPEPGTTECTDKFIPSIRLELLRESFEDYEYFILANNGQKPEPFVENHVDIALRPIIPSMTGYNPDTAAMMWMRKEIGKYISSQRTSLPDKVLTSPARPFGEYHINFQDPSGNPTENPLVIDGKTWMKVGWSKYDPETQIGWFSDDFDFTDGRLIHDYDQYEDGNDLQKSYVVNAWGGREVFMFGIENGVYNIEINAGRRSRQRPYVISVNGVPFFGDHNSGTTESIEGHEIRSKQVSVYGGMLVMEIGCRSCSINYDEPKNHESNELTHVSYMSITPVSKNYSLKDVITILQILCGMSGSIVSVDDVNQSTNIDLAEAIYVLRDVAGLN